MKKLWMVKEEEGSNEWLEFKNIDFYDFKRPATKKDETIEAMAIMLDRAAESCNAHDFVGCHQRLAVILKQEAGVRVATKIMRRLVNYTGLYGLIGVCGEGDEALVEDELGQLFAE